jgi:K+-sensing histidine kinase KdpD
LKDVNINFASVVDIATTMKVDRNLFETAVRNLLDNAIKYSPAEKQIDIKCLTSRGKYKIEIRNEYNSIKKLKISDLFKKFKRGSNAREIAGSGLGLSIAREAIVASKGDLKIRQYDGNLVCATLTLPL